MSEVIIGAVVTAAVGFVLAAAWKGYSERRMKPLVNIHHWWVRVIDPELLRLSRDVFVATKRAAGGGEYDRYLKERHVLDKIDEIHSGTMNKEREIESVVLPAFKLARKSASVDTVLALRVSIHNTSRRYVVGTEDLRLLLDVRIPPGNVLGWNRNVLGVWPEAPFATEEADPKAVILPVQVPERLGAKKAVRDEFVVCLLSEPRPPGWEPEVRVEQTESRVRLRVKPWMPTSKKDSSRHLRIVGRAVRWLGSAYLPPGPAEYRRG